MRIKSGTFAILEAIQAEMRADPRLTLFWQDRPTAISPLGRVIDLGKEFGDVRIPRYTAIDEEWYVGACAGMAMSGIPAIAHTPCMCSARFFDLAFNQIGKLRHMTGGQVSMPLVIWQDSLGRLPGIAGQHADAGQEALFAALPGLKVVIPSNPYDAKGLMASAIRDPDPVVFFDYLPTHNVRVDVPDEPYTVPIGEATIVKDGKDLTIVAFGPALLEVTRALPMLSASGVDAEVIDPRSLKPLPMDAILRSVRKTGRLLAVDHGHQTLCGVTEIITRCALKGVGTRFVRLSFPDAPSPGCREMITWMTPDAPKIVEAAKKMLTKSSGQ